MQLEAAGLLDKIGEDRIFLTLPTAVEAYRNRRAPSRPARRSATTPAPTRTDRSAAGAPAAAAARKADGGNHLGARGSLPKRWRSRSTAAPRTTRSRSRRARPPPPRHRDDDADHHLGAVRAVEPRMHRGQRVRQMPVAGHRQRGPRDAEDQSQQRAQRRHRGADPHHRFQAGKPAARTASASGALADASPALPNSPAPRPRPPRTPTSVMPSAIGIARGMVRAGSRTSSPSVAMRAYPANAKNSSPAACSTPRDADVVAQSPAASRPTSPKPRTTTTTAASTASTTATMIRVSSADLLDAGVVHRGQRDHGRHRDRVRQGRPRVVADCQRHRRAGRRLADDEAPARRCNPRTRRAARGRRRRCRRTADTARPAAPTTSRCSRRRRPRPPARSADPTPPPRPPGQRNEHAGADHRAQPDRHRVDRAEPPLQRRAVRRAHGSGCYVRRCRDEGPAIRGPTLLPTRR